MRFLRMLRRFVAMLFVICSGAPVAAEPADAEMGRGKRSREADTIFSHTNVPRIQIEVPKEGMTKLRSYQWEWGTDKTERLDALATVKEGGRVYTNVSIHLKGAAGSFRPVDQNPALTLNFGKFAKGQTFHGLEKFSLNNSVQDSSFLSEKIARELFEAAGVPVPRSDFATVELNGRKLGLYVLVEGFNKQFLGRYFKNTKGNLYEGGFLGDVDAELEVNSGDNPKDQSPLKRLVAAAQEPDSRRRFARLEKVLDTDRFITFIAMEVLLVHWDGYSMNRNNYRIFHHLDSDRLVFLPHGLDMTFGVMRSEPNMPLKPAMEGLVAVALLETVEGRARYFGRISQLATNLIKIATLTNRVNELAARIRPVIAARNPADVKSHEKAVAGMIDRIVKRGRSLEEQLAKPGQALKFGPAGAVPVSGWTTHTNFGQPELAHALDRQGRRLFYVHAGSGSSVGSWRTKVVLEDGKYRLEGRVKAKNVKSDPGDRKGGVGFRVSGRRFTQPLLGNVGWTNAVCEFEVQEGVADIELICELRAATGEAWFDADSLRLVRK